MSRKIGLSNILEYLLAFAIFLSGESIWIQYIPQRHQVMHSIISFLLLVYIILRNRVETKDVLFASILAVIPLAHAVLLRTGITICIYRITIPIFFYYLALAGQVRDGMLYGIPEKYSNITYVFALVSILLYLLGTILHILTPSTATYNWAGLTLNVNNYFGLMYEAQRKTLFGYEMPVNCGIFAEAPSYAVPLIFAFFYELFVSRKTRKTRLVVLAIAALTSQSVKAISIIILVVALKMTVTVYSRHTKKRTLLELAKLFTPIIITVGIIIAYNIVSARSMESIQRIDNLNACIRAFRAHKLFGVGIANESALVTYQDTFFRWNGYSMGIAVLVAEGGIYLTLFYLVGYIGGIIRSSNRTLTVCFIATFLSILFVSNIPYFPVSIYILAMMYAILINGGRSPE